MLKMLNAKLQIFRKTSSFLGFLKKNSSLVCKLILQKRLLRN